MPARWLWRLATLPALVPGQRQPMEPVSESGMRLSGRHLRIMTVEDPPLITVRDHSGRMLPSDQWSGFVIRVIRRMAEPNRANFTYTLMLPSGGNQSFSYRQAEADVVMGGPDGPDLYWAGAYITARRLADARMTVPFMHDPLAVLVRASTEGTWSQQVWGFTLPFSGPLWGAWFITILVGSLMFLWLEGYAERARREDFHRESARVFVGKLLESVYFTTGTVNGGQAWTPETTLGKVWALFFGLFTWILTATYTGEIVNFIARPVVPAYSPPSFAHFLQGDSHPVCVLRNSAYAAWLRDHPTYQFLTLREEDGMLQMLQALQSRHCDGVISTASHLEWASFTTDVDVCRLHTDKSSFHVLHRFEDGPQVMAPGVKFTHGGPGDDLAEVHEKLSYWITHMSQDGSIRELYRLSVRQNGCHGFFRTTTQGRRSFLQLGGPFFILAGIGVLVFGASLASCARSRRQPSIGRQISEQASVKFHRRRTLQPDVRAWDMSALETHLSGVLDARVAGERGAELPEATVLHHAI